MEKIDEQKLFWCCGCEEFHSKSAFSKANNARGANGKAGIQAYCKEYKKQYKEGNKEHIRQQDKEYRNRPETQLARRQYRRDNKEQIKACNDAIKQSIRQFIIELKIDKPCYDCGLIFPCYCMDFDHMDDYEKCFNIGDATAHKYSKESILAEIAKCQLICAVCHKIRTHDRRQLNATVYEYKNKKFNDKKRNRSYAIIDQHRSEPCLDCHNTFPVYCMEFDHIDGSKVLPVANMVLYSEKRLIAEIDKCEVVCVNCHRIRTFNRKEKVNEEEQAQF